MYQSRTKTHDCVLYWCSKTSLHPQELCPVQDAQLWKLQEWINCDWLKPVSPTDWMTLVSPTDWLTLVSPTDWLTLVSPTDWLTLVSPTDWLTLVSPTDWLTLVSPTDWMTLVSPTDWMTLVFPTDWLTRVPYGLDDTCVPYKLFHPNVADYPWAAPYLHTCHSSEMLYQMISRILFSEPSKGSENTNFKIEKEVMVLSRNTQKCRLWRPDGQLHKKTICNLFWK